MGPGGSRTAEKTTARLRFAADAGFATPVPDARTSAPVSQPTRVPHLESRGAGCLLFCGDRVEHGSDRPASLCKVSAFPCPVAGHLAILISKWPRNAVA